MEEQTKRMVLLSLAAVGVVVIVFAAIFYVRSRGQKTAQLPATEVREVADLVQPSSDQVQTPEPLQKLQKLPEDSKEAQLKRFCIDFIARFGTYSTDGESANLEQLLPLMSGELKTWANARLSNKTVAEKFSGVTTKALSSKIISYSADAAVVQLNTQRSFVEGMVTRVAYEDATMTLVNTGGWRVVSVTWKAKAE